jgi:lipopolysaccharide transport system permease protein
MTESIGNEKWDIHITSGSKPLDLNAKETWRYRDLMMMFVKRDIITVYKQTILGPLWFIIQPLLTSLMFLVVFSGIAGISTGNVPPILFYMTGTILWNYFADTLNITSRTFTDNASIFGKVYFPRIILPMSKVISGLIKFLIQFSLFAVILLYYMFFYYPNPISTGIHGAMAAASHTSIASVVSVASAYSPVMTPNWYILLTPVWLLIVVLLSLGFGIIITSLTTKYRDLMFLVAFGVQLAMYVTPVIYPLSTVHGHKRTLVLINPLTSLFEAFKYGFFGKGAAGSIDIMWLLYSVGFTLITLTIGIIIFNRVEKKFIDTV